MCGGRESTFRKLKPLLKDLSQSLRYVGPTGQAAQVKALVNMVMNINTAGLAEGLALGDALAWIDVVAGSVLPDRRKLPRLADRRGGHAESRTLLLLQRCPRRQG